MTLNRLPSPRTGSNARRHLALWLVAVLATGSLVANAHPGHALTDATVQHVATSPYHLAALALGGLALVGLGKLARPRFPRQLLQLSGATLMVMAVLALGWRS